MSTTPMRLALTPEVSPCKGCAERAVGCHGNCERYAKYRAYREEIRARRREAQKEREDSYTSGSMAVLTDRKRYEKQRGRRYN